MAHGPQHLRQAQRAKSLCSGTQPSSFSRSSRVLQRSDSFWYSPRPSQDIFGVYDTVAMFETWGHNDIVIMVLVEASQERAGFLIARQISSRLRGCCPQLLEGEQQETSFSPLAHHLKICLPFGRPTSNSLFRTPYGTELRSGSRSGDGYRLCLTS